MLRKLLPCRTIIKDSLSSYVIKSCRFIIVRRKRRVVSSNSLYLSLSFSFFLSHSISLSFSHTHIHKYTLFLRDNSTSRFDIVLHRMLFALQSKILTKGRTTRRSMNLFINLIKISLFLHDHFLSQFSILLIIIPLTVFYLAFTLNDPKVGHRSPVTFTPERRYAPVGKKTIQRTRTKREEE